MVKRNAKGAGINEDITSPALRHYVISTPKIDVTPADEDMEEAMNRFKEFIA